MEGIVVKPKSKVVRVRVGGPLASHQPALASILAERGYTPLTRVNHFQVMAHLSQWLAVRGFGVADLTSDRVDEYLTQRQADGYSAFCSRGSIRSLLEVLCSAGAPVTGPDPAPVSAADELLAGYDRFLRHERGLVASTTTAYVLRARRFLDGYGHGAVLHGLDTAAITAAVLREAGTGSAGSAQFFVVALRSFLRYCHLTGLIGTDMSGAALPVTGRRRSVLPRGLTSKQARALLSTCDRRTARGRRDYAVLVLLLRLGLRSREVAALQLEDIDWRAGQIAIHGKGHREDRLPLPADVGQAIAGYLRHGRPNDGPYRDVFLRSLAPQRGLSREAVALIVRRAGIRAGLGSFGPHRLRHTVATDMVAAGIGLGPIGQVLRHSDASSTSIYARVDIEQLRAIARPLHDGGVR